MLVVETIAKIRRACAGPVARGDVELAVITTPYVVLEPGVDLVGPLPKELQNYVVYTNKRRKQTAGRRQGSDQLPHIGAYCFGAQVSRARSRFALEERRNNSGPLIGPEQKSRCPSV
jgi:hypothetical protein